MTSPNCRCTWYGPEEPLYGPEEPFLERSMTERLNLIGLNCRFKFVRTLACLTTEEATAIVRQNLSRSTCPVGKHVDEKSLEIFPIYNREESFENDSIPSPSTPQQYQKVTVTTPCDSISYGPMTAIEAERYAKNIEQHYRDKGCNNVVVSIEDHYLLKAAIPEFLEERKEEPIWNL